MRNPVHVLLFCGVLAGCATTPGAAPDKADPIATIPLEPYLKVHAVLHAEVDGQPGTFIFDTGGGVAVISSALAEKIGCRPWGQVTAFRMTGERLDAPHCDKVTITAAGQSFNPPAAISFDIMKLLGPGVPPVDGLLGLDIFAGKQITILPRQAIVIESPASFARRIAGATELPVRLVRDGEGVSLTYNGAVTTPQGTAYMELDTGNGGPSVIANHIAPLFGLKPDTKTPQSVRFQLANGMWFEGPVYTRDLIMDGNIGAQFLNNYALTLDLKDNRAWLAPFPPK